MSIVENLERVREQIAAACAKAGRSEADVALMAVSKTHPASAIEEAYAAGQRLFGENRVQEWEAKSAQLSLPGLEMHLIGPLQSNKTNKAAGLFHTIEAVDSLRIAQRLDTAAQALGRRLPILIEIKLSHEDSKHGMAPQELPALLEALPALSHVIPVGLMTVPPLDAQGEEARPYFRRLRELRDQAQTRIATLTHLSMGMSHDYTVAIEEGSTCVRVGTAIFGEREYSQP
ncbi:YggS family pyridoxal phosphate-dependent enzyme [Terriglobus albidus]|uniref:Pyridoxal phosphate homeostasis protein n=1 Tax=Terriglobus albidus TaxID=1592106 RepID=A0A5B9EGA2_9BACT|nr:YggS family pyridoxal phosphate-dependent enzyme [Terriglobus albidus]QEE30175.1 YggS family pyridoxal phosphate-dependent enzyme [Terriglobus albidus]